MPPNTSPVMNSSQLKSNSQTNDSTNANNNPEDIKMLSKSNITNTETTNENLRTDSNIDKLGETISRTGVMAGEKCRYYFWG